MPTPAKSRMYVQGASQGCHKAEYAPPTLDIHEKYASSNDGQMNAFQMTLGLDKTEHHLRHSLATAQAFLLLKGLKEDSPSASRVPSLHHLDF